MKKTLYLTHPEARRQALSQLCLAPDGYKVTIEPPKRSLDQNALLWPLLACFSEQLEWHVNGEKTFLEPECWKDILTAAFKSETNPIRVTPGLNGGVVLIGTRTSKMNKAEFSEFLEFIYATAAERGVQVDRHAQE